MTDGEIVYEAPAPSGPCEPDCTNRPTALQRDLFGRVLEWFHHPDTVWRCGKCGRTWVVEESGGWRPERRREIRRRLRRARRAGPRTAVGGNPSSGRKASDLKRPVSVCPPVSAPKDVLPPSAAVSPDPDGDHE